MSDLSAAPTHKRSFFDNLSAKLHLVSEAKLETKAATNHEETPVTQEEKMQLAELAKNPDNRKELYHTLWKRLNDTSKHWPHVMKALEILDYFLLHNVEGINEELQIHDEDLIQAANYNHAKEHTPEESNHINRVVTEKAKRLRMLFQDRKLLEQEKAKLNPAESAGLKTVNNIHVASSSKQDSPGSISPERSADGAAISPDRKVVTGESQAQREATFRPPQGFEDHGLATDPARQGIAMRGPPAKAFSMSSNKDAAATAHSINAASLKTQVPTSGGSLPMIDRTEILPLRQDAKKEDLQQADLMKQNDLKKQEDFKKDAAKKEQLKNSDDKLSRASSEEQQHQQKLAGAHPPKLHTPQEFLSKEEQDKLHPSADSNPNLLELARREKAGASFEGPASAKSDAKLEESKRDPQSTGHQLQQQKQKSKVEPLKPSALDAHRGVNDDADAERSRNLQQLDLDWQKQKSQLDAKNRDHHHHDAQKKDAALPINHDLDQTAAKNPAEIAQQARRDETNKDLAFQTAAQGFAQGAIPSTIDCQTPSLDRPLPAAADARLSQVERAQRSDKERKQEGNQQVFAHQVQNDQQNAKADLRDRETQEELQQHGTQLERRPLDAVKVDASTVTRKQQPSLPEQEGLKEAQTSPDAKKLQKEGNQQIFDHSLQDQQKHYAKADQIDKHREQVVKREGSQLERRQEPQDPLLPTQHDVDVAASHARAHKRSAFDEVNERRASLQSERSLTDAHRQEALKSLQKANQELSTASDIVYKQEKNILSWNAEVEKLRQAAKVLEEGSGAASDQLNALKDQLTKAQMQMEKLNAELKTNRSKLASAEAEAKKAHEKSEELHRQLEQKSGELKEFEKRHQQEVAETRKQVQEEKTALQVSSGRALQSLMEAHEAELRKLKDQQQKQLSELEQQRAMLESQVSILSQQGQQSESRLKQTKSLIEEKTREMDSQRQKHAKDLESLNVQLKNQCESMKRDLEKNSNQLEKNLDSMRDQLKEGDAIAAKMKEKDARLESTKTTEHLSAERTHRHHHREERDAQQSTKQLPTIKQQDQQGLQLSSSQQQVQRTDSFHQAQKHTEERSQEDQLNQKRASKSKDDQLEDLGPHEPRTLRSADRKRGVSDQERREMTRQSGLRAADADAPHMMANAQTDVHPGHTAELKHRDRMVDFPEDAAANHQTENVAADKQPAASTEKKSPSQKANTKQLRQDMAAYSAATSTQ